MASDKKHYSGLLGLERLLKQSGDHFNLGWKPKIITLEPRFGYVNGQKQPDLWVIGDSSQLQAVFEYKCCPRPGTHYHQAQEQLLSCKEYADFLFGCDAIMLYCWGLRGEYERL